MYHNLNTNIDLYGEYRIRVIDGKNVISDTGWCKNTILSAGLVSLSSLSIPEVINSLDLGTSLINPGSAGYGLSGVQSKCVNNELINIERDSLQTFIDNKSTKVYVAGYTSDFTSTSNETIREFCVKTSDGVGFSRNVLPNELVINYGQAVNFEYRLSIGWASTYSIKVPFKTTTQTFYVDTTTTTYNIPYDRAYYNNNKLLLLRNNEALPVFGSNYPASLDYTFNNLYYSTFSPTTVVASINNSSRTMSVYDEYVISSPETTGILSPVNTALIVKDGNIDIPSNKFMVTRFNYPLYLYNYSNIEDTNLLPVVNTIPRLSQQYNCLKRNIMSLCYRYSWRETTTSRPTGVTNLTQLPTLSNICPENISIYCGTTVEYAGSTSTNLYNVIFDSATGSVSLTYDTNGVPVRFRVIYDDNEVINTGFVGDANYNGALVNLGFGPVVGPSTGLISFNKNSSSVNTAYVYIDSPISRSDYSFNLSCPL